MNGRGASLAALVVLLASARPALVRADDDFGTDDEVQQPIVISLAVTSMIGTLVTGSAAIVYAINGKAFDTPWLVAALFSGALTVGTGVSLLTFDGDVAPPVGVGLIALGAWPLAYSVRSALSPGGYGAPLTQRMLPPPGALAFVPLVTLEL